MDAEDGARDALVGTGERVGSTEATLSGPDTANAVGAAVSAVEACSLTDDLSPGAASDLVVEVGDDDSDSEESRDDDEEFEAFVNSDDEMREAALARANHRNPYLDANPDEFDDSDDSDYDPHERDGGGQSKENAIEIADDAAGRDVGSGHTPQMARKRGGREAVDQAGAISDRNEDEDVDESEADDDDDAYDDDDNDDDAFAAFVDSDDEMRDAAAARATRVNPYLAAGQGADSEDEGDSDYEPPAESASPAPIALVAQHAGSGGAAAAQQPIDLLDVDAN